MRKRIWLFVIILAIPILGIIVSTGFQIYFNSQLHTALQAQYPEVDKAVIAGFNINMLCQIDNQLDDPDLTNICVMVTHLNWMARASIAAAIVGLALLFVIWLAGRLGQNNRSILLVLFRPGLYITSATLVALIVVQAAVAIGAIYYGESIILGGVHMKIIILIGLGALYGVMSIARNIFVLVRKAETGAIGCAITREQAPPLWQQVDDIANKLDALTPDHIVVGLDPNFYVTEADVVCMNGKLTGRTLYCSLPLSRILHQDELAAVIGHELGHFVGEDTKFSERFFPIYRGTFNSLEALASASDKGFNSLALLPALAILSYFLECFAIAERQISRQRELMADQAGVRVTSPTIFSSALLKIHAFARLWEDFQESTTKAWQDGQELPNVSKSYIEVVVAAADTSAFADINETSLQHPTDTHPPLGTRLEALGVDLSNITTTALDINPADAAIQLIPQYEQVEEKVSAACKAFVTSNNDAQTKADPAA